MAVKATCGPANILIHSARGVVLPRAAAYLSKEVGGSVAHAMNGFGLRAGPPSEWCDSRQTYHSLKPRGQTGPQTGLVMPPKRKPPPLLEPGKGPIHGWSFSYNDQGVCNVGTAAGGPYRRFAIDLKRYEGYAADPAAAVLKGLLERRKDPGPSATTAEVECHQSLLADESGPVLGGQRSELHALIESQPIDTCRSS
eukprot:5715442-Prymnesium_polylepis.1